MVPPYSHRVSRVRRYSGTGWADSTFRLQDSHLLWFAFPHNSTKSCQYRVAVLTPKIFLLSVWSTPRSLATTYGISFDFSSSPYLDVSVQAVPHIYLFYSVYVDRPSSAGLPHSDIPGYNACLQLPEAFRS